MYSEFMLGAIVIQILNLIAYKIEGDRFNWNVYLSSNITILTVVFLLRSWFS
jgi:hypothetical protein